MIKICYIIDSAYAGGAERYVALIAGALDRGRFSPSVIARSGPGLDGWCRQIDAQGIPVARTAMGLPFRPFDAEPIVRAIRQFSPHIVHINMPGPYDGQMGLLAPLARLGGARSVITTEHLPMVEKLWKRALVKRFSYMWVDRVLTVCRSNVSFLIERQRVPQRKIAVLSNALPIAYGKDRGARRASMRSALGIDRRSVALAMVGSLIKRKGLDTLLDALAGSAADNWILFVAGSGEERSPCAKKAASLGIGSRVKFLGELAAREIEDLLCAMDVLVLPSFMEGMPYVILEAMACAVPVVASAIHGIPEASPDGEVGLLVPPGDVRALRSALETLLRDEATRLEMGRRGRQRFEAEFTLEKQIRSLEEIYTGVVDRHR